MKKILHNILLLAILLHPVCNPLAKADTFTVEGQCIVTKKGDLYIYLVDERTFQIPLTGIKKMIRISITSRSKSSNRRYTTDNENIYFSRTGLTKQRNG